MTKSKKIEKLLQSEDNPWFDWNSESHAYFLNAVGATNVIMKINEIIDELNKREEGK